MPGVVISLHSLRHALIETWQKKTPNHFIFLLQSVISNINMANLAEQASKLLDFDQKLDITLLDSIVGCMYSGAGEQVTFSSGGMNLCIQVQSLL